MNGMMLSSLGSIDPPKSPKEKQLDRRNKIECLPREWKILSAEAPLLG
jgi:hypothetical protein